MTLTKQVLAYLSRYNHRVAMSNRRLISADAQSVTFAYKDYAHGGKAKTMRLRIEEFVRRFCLHVLPEGFVKIRHYGLLGNRKRKERLWCARKLLGTLPPPVQPEVAAGRQTPIEPPRAYCPFCQRASLVLVREVRPTRATTWVQRLDSS